MFKNNFNGVLHFIGIGGIGMSGIAEVLLSMGYKVSGSDIAESANTSKLRQMGAEIFIGHKKENAKNASIVIYSSAVTKENPEMMVARECNLPVMRRAEMLAELMRLKHGLAVAGTHGKTTTTSFLATILQGSDYDPTYIIGGIVKNLNGHAKVGKGDFLVAEADESDGSFLLLNPIMSVVTNIDNDHMDHYKTEENLLASFEEFLNKVPFYGMSALNAHDARLMEMVKRIKKPFSTFGISDELDFTPDFGAKNITFGEISSTFNLVVDGEIKAAITINLPGRHNILNALGAISIAGRMGITFESIAKSIKNFDGVGRRFQQLYKDSEIEIIDDYGHHPTEVMTTLKTLRDTRKGRVVCIFEPHRYTRTRDCWEQFLHCFNSVDQVYISPIYAASELPIDGIDSSVLVRDINKLHPNTAVYLEDLSQLHKVIMDNKGSVIATLGAGSIGKKIREWVLDYESH